MFLRGSVDRRPQAYGLNVQHIKTWEDRNGRRGEMAEWSMAVVLKTPQQLGHPRINPRVFSRRHQDCHHTPRLWPSEQRAYEDVHRLLFVAFVVLLVSRQGMSTQRVATGTVAEIHHGDWMLVTNEGMRLPVALVEKTTYKGNPADLKPGTRVTVWYRGVAERRPVADRVRVPADARWNGPGLLKCLRVSRH
jgi:hypothetical protein